ncbi:hypothetical protein K440DRAFT_609686 [Wilcoxina mikolae CBS 423.85]|nr:hypothetical protein K440DRAFT_609686 [Wilcoxina mikolae CBS 423.85]
MAAVTSTFDHRQPSAAANLGLPRRTYLRKIVILTAVFLIATLTVVSWISGDMRVVQGRTETIDFPVVGCKEKGESGQSGYLQCWLGQH